VYSLPVHRRGITHDLKRFLKPLQVFQSNQDGGGPAMHCRCHSLVMIMNAADELGQMGLDVPQRQHGHSQKYDQNLPQRRT
jgi:hypothetical protein